MSTFDVVSAILCHLRKESSTLALGRGNQFYSNTVIIDPSCRIILLPSQKATALSVPQLLKTISQSPCSLLTQLHSLISFWTFYFITTIIDILEDRDDPQSIYNIIPHNLNMSVNRVYNVCCIIAMLGEYTILIVNWLVVTHLYLSLVCWSAS